MDERGMWKGLQPILAYLSLDPVRVENGLDRGTPDANYTHGWIELKYLERWPKRAETLVRLPKLTPWQCAWLKRRWAAGGLCWLIVRVGQEWFVFSGWVAHSVRLGLTREQFMKTASWKTGGRPTIAEIAKLRSLLTSPINGRPR